ncbi:MAG: dTDP-4-dehydrorhamnose 3,5-epimerase, partial [[Clostridium] innocuum]|nr:dTDP-4-dehydrorhamnose 3,5-epimerase [[Clostridium] innocuum]
MGQIKVEKNVGGIEGLCVIEPAVHGDARGYFMETYNEKDMKEAGIDIHFVQDNQSMSTKGVLRGLHFQKQYPQCKLVRAVRGTVFDVAVDLRSNSETYGKWYGVTLSAENKKQFLIPEGFAHGFLVLSDEAEFCYPLSDVMGGWGIWETVNGEQQLTTECIENVIMMVPFSAVVMWTFGEKIGNSWKEILWQSGKIAFIFSISIEMLQLLMRLGTFQLSDIFYNTVGGM